MTAMTQPVPPAHFQPPPVPSGRPERVKVETAGNDALEQYFMLLEQRKAEAAEASARVDELRDAIQAELFRAHPGNAMPLKAFDIPAHPSGYHPAYTIAWRTPRRFNRDDFDRDYPGIYESYLRYGKGHWETREK